jgi:hypothetical protein
MGDTSGNGFTNKEILIRLEEKVDKILDDHEKRLRILERFRYGVPASLIAAIGSAAASAVLLIR